MFYYVDTSTGAVYAFSGEDVANGLVIAGLRAMTAAEVELHLNPPERYWTDGSYLFLTAANDMDGMWLASEEEISNLMAPTKLREAQYETVRLRKIADDAIAPLQDAMDLGEATAEEGTELTAWKRYRVALNRLHDQPGYPNEITWPAPPA